MTNSIKVKLPYLLQNDKIWVEQLKLEQERTGPLQEVISMNREIKKRKARKNNFSIFSNLKALNKFVVWQLKQVVA